MSMKFKDMLNKKTKLFEEEVPESNIKDDNYYFNMVDPETQNRYNIPMLSPVDPGYYYEYIYYMKMKEKTPDTFNKILGWE